MTEERPQYRSTTEEARIACDLITRLLQNAVAYHHGGEGLIKTMSRVRAKIEQAIRTGTLPRLGDDDDLP